MSLFCRNQNRSLSSTVFDSASFDFGSDLRTLWIFRVLHRSVVQALDEIVAVVFGFGYEGGEGSSASDFRLIVILVVKLGIYVLNVGLAIVENFGIQLRYAGR
ncbi:Hypothetical_protein [Hexamita inflata]|uniref:Hypothetical_protein n=1 Tax=Hexamita inflata TaxID=28002 RepID=A0AA86QWT9_9EUKA|nr:Hypothetical protein HINF_LOCUS53263 [Hexamita inflata]